MATRLIFAVDYNDGRIAACAGDEVSGLADHRIGVLEKAGVIRRVDVLDHDGDHRHDGEGARGGSRKGAASSAAKGARRGKR